MINSIEELADINLKKSETIEEKLMYIIQNKKTYEDILKEICNEFEIRMDYGQYVLVGNTIRSFLSYLYNSGKAKYTFEDNKMYWEAN